MQIDTIAKNLQAAFNAVSIEEVMKAVKALQDADRIKAGLKKLTSENEKLTEDDQQKLTVEAKATLCCQDSDMGQALVQPLFNNAQRRNTECVVKLKKNHVKTEEVMKAVQSLQKADSKKKLARIK